MEWTMKIDVYTKAVLTIIALCLIWISVRDLPLAKTVNAQFGPSGQSVVITGWNLPGPIPVAVRNEHPLPVGISFIQPGKGYQGVAMPWESIKVIETSQPPNQHTLKKGKE